MEICTALIAILSYLEATFGYDYFIIFLCYSSKILHKKFQVILSKNEGVTVIFTNFDFILNRENQHHGFIFALFLKKNSFNCLFTTRGTEIPLIINPI